MKLEFREAQNDAELVFCSNLEKESYPESEAASLEKFRWRHNLFPELFRIALVDGNIVGYVCSTRCDEFTEETMEKEFNKKGKVIAIHSVVIQNDFRRKSLATVMMKNYIHKVTEKVTDFDRFELICKVKYSGLYIGCGFNPIRMSEIEHGGDSWLLCTLKRTARKFYVVDAFTAESGKGNPAAVVFCYGFESKGWMQKVAAEFNLAETAFVTRIENDLNEYKLLFFTPISQINFCGHATLATAKSIFSDTKKSSELTFVLSDGLKLKAKQSTKSNIMLEFPVQMPREFSSSDIRNALSNVFKLQENDVLYTGKFENRAIIEVTPESYIKMFEVDIDFANLSSLSNDIVLWIITTRKLTGFDDKYSPADFYSRVFVPKLGIPEDPVTGSVHSSLFPYYKNKYLKSQEEIVAVQTSKRSGILKATIQEGKVKLHVNAVIVSRGEIYMSQ